MEQGNSLGWSICHGGSLSFFRFIERLISSVSISISGRLGGGRGEEKKEENSRRIEFYSLTYTRQFEKRKEKPPANRQMDYLQRQI